MWCALLTVSHNGIPVATLNKGEFIELPLTPAPPAAPVPLTTPAAIVSSHPVLVAQYSQSASVDGPLASAINRDPFMMLVQPVEQYLASYVVMSPAGYSGQYVNVIAPDAALGSITLDGGVIPAASFAPIGSSGFSGVQIASLSAGSHVLKGPLAFAVLVYGFSSFDGYGYPGGLSLDPVAAVGAVGLSPSSASVPVDTPHCVDATVTYGDNTPIAGVHVSFTVTGTHSAGGSVTTGAQGQAQFCYTGTVGGTDTLTASVSGVETTATVTWLDNQPPDLSGAAPTRACFPATRHQFALVGITGVTDPDIGDVISIAIASIRSDEPTASSSGAGGASHGPDAVIQTDGTALIRTERSGAGDGRVYHISFMASDGQDAASGTVTVAVSHDRRGGACSAGDGGPRYDATAIN